MKRTQNEKILQIKNETLVVGVDIAKKIHFARAFDNRGIELGKLLRFENSAQGFANFDAWLQGIMQKNEMTGVMVGFEPTGHYWFNLGDHLKVCGHKLAIVNPFHVKCARELDDNSPSKSDPKTQRPKDPKTQRPKDPKTIAMLVKDGRYRDVYIPVGVYQELRELVCERERLQERLGSLKNQIVRLLDIHFPEFTTVFKDWSKERAEYINGEDYERTDNLVTSRNGYYDRAYLTRVGNLELKVPRTRDGKFSASIFEKYQGNEKALLASMLEMYVSGVSTRKVTNIVEKFCGKSVSKSFVS